MSSTPTSSKADLQESAAEIGVILFGLLTVLYYSINAPSSGNTTRFVGFAVFAISALSFWVVGAKSGLPALLAGIISVCGVALVAQCLAWLVGGSL